jgi:hypothetical protein
MARRFIVCQSIYPRRKLIMKRLVYLFAILSVLLFACSIATTATPPVVTSNPTSPVIPTATEPPVATQPPVATEPPAPQPNAICNELALFLDPALSSGYNCETVPASTEGMEMHPQYTQLTLNGYVLSDRFFTPHISVYPVQAFTPLYPTNIPADIAALQALIGGGSTGSNGLPLLPYFNAGQEFFAQYEVLPFGSGNGIRYLTQYSQYFDPINNHELFYTFQGLTDDGIYWISAILPISNPILPADGSTPPNGQSQEQFGNNFATYIADITAQLNAQSVEDYSPSITLLDALIASITIQP